MNLPITKRTKKDYNEDGYSEEILNEKGMLTMTSEALFSGHEFEGMSLKMKADHAEGMGWRRGVRIDQTGYHSMWYRPRGL